MNKDYVSAWAIPGIKEAYRLETCTVESRVKRIIEKVGGYFGVTEAEIMCSVRDRYLTVPRHFCMFFIRQNIGLSYKIIGGFLGNRDHTTIISGVNLINSQISLTYDNPIKTDYANLIKII